VAEEDLLRSVFRRARSLGLLASCHCELGQAQPPAGTDPAAHYSSPANREADRRAEIEGVDRAIRLARESGCRLHLAHLSTRESIGLVRREKARLARAGAPGRGGTGGEGEASPEPGFRLSCEATPHHLALTEADAERLGAGGGGRVNPWLRGEDDRLAVVEGLLDGSIDCIATDHAPHSPEDKAGGAPGFSGLETAFALSNETLVRGGGIGLSRLSALMSRNPATILGLHDRGLLAPGLRADLVLVDPDAALRIDPALFKSRGKNSPLGGKTLHGKILMTIHEGRIVHDSL
jgi:dihydroorotase